MAGGRLKIEMTRTAVQHRLKRSLQMPAKIATLLVLASVCTRAARARPLRWVGAAAATAKAAGVEAGAAAAGVGSAAA
eukprot:scaffold274_cov78-Skeletonema_dohrnii-CCMP3373.AAC.5